MKSNVYRAASLQFMPTLLKFLEGTLVKEIIEDLRERNGLVVR
jgi:hypothetical protein